MLKLKKIISLPVLLVFIFFGMILFWDLGKNYLTNWDEAWYADISRSMSQSGNLFTPIWNTRPFFDKPPLYFWLTAFVNLITVPSEFSIRFVSAASGLGTILLIYGLAKTLWTKEAALIASIVLGSTIGFLYRARTGNLDMLLAFLIMLSIVTFYKKWLYLSGAVIGAAFLTKGMLAFVFPAIAAAYLYFKEPKKLFDYTKSIAIGLVIALTWVGLSYLINGPDFLNQFRENQFNKISTDVIFLTNFSLEYIFHLKSGLKLWFILFIPASVYFWYRLRQTNQFLIISFFLILLTFLSFFENKSNWFLVPLYPVVALIIGFAAGKFGRLGVILVGLIAVGQLMFFRSDYMVPDIVVDEARVAQYAAKIIDENMPIYLTHYYAPTTVYYSQRVVYAVYSEQENNAGWWIKPKSSWASLLKQSGIYIITTNSDFKELQNNYPEVRFETLFSSGQKLLIKTL